MVFVTKYSKNVCPSKKKRQIKICWVHTLVKCAANAYIDQNAHY